MAIFKALMLKTKMSIVVVIATHSDSGVIKRIVLTLGLIRVLLVIDAYSGNRSLQAVGQCSFEHELSAAHPMSAIH